MSKQKTLRCNGCGKTIYTENGIEREACLKVEQEWGYFSEKDGERHSFCLCENCYDQMIRGFVVPVDVEEYL